MSCVLIVILVRIRAEGGAGIPRLGWHLPSVGSAPASLLGSSFCTRQAATFRMRLATVHAGPLGPSRAGSVDMVSLLDQRNVESAANECRIGVVAPLNRDREGVERC